MGRAEGRLGGGEETDNGIIEEGSRRGRDESAEPSEKPSEEKSGEETQLDVDHGLPSFLLSALPCCQLALNGKANQKRSSSASSARLLSFLSSCRAPLSLSFFLRNGISLSFLSFFSFRGLDEDKSATLSS